MRIKSPERRQASFVAVMMLVLLGGCGSATPPRIAEKPDVTITFDGQHHACAVALYTEAQGSTIPCGELIPFLRDELRLKRGSIYDVRTIPVVDEAEMARVGANLQEAGYRFIGGRKVKFITGPL